MPHGEPARKIGYPKAWREAQHASVSNQQCEAALPAEKQISVQNRDQRMVSARDISLARRPVFDSVAPESGMPFAPQKSSRKCLCLSPRTVRGVRNTINEQPTDYFGRDFRPRANALHSLLYGPDATRLLSAPLTLRPSCARRFGPDRT